MLGTDTWTISVRLLCLEVFGCRSFLTQDTTRWPSVVFLHATRLGSGLIRNALWRRLRRHPLGSTGSLPFFIEKSRGSWVKIIKCCWTLKPKMLLEFWTKNINQDLYWLAKRWKTILLFLLVHFVTVVEYAGIIFSSVFDHHLIPMADRIIFPFFLKSSSWTFLRFPWFSSPWHIWVGGLLGHGQQDLASCPPHRTSRKRRCSRQETTRKNYASQVPCLLWNRIIEVLVHSFHQLQVVWKDSHLQKSVLESLETPVGNHFPSKAERASRRGLCTAASACLRIDRTFSHWQLPNVWEGTKSAQKCRVTSHFCGRRSKTSLGGSCLRETHSFQQQNAGL